MAYKPNQEIVVGQTAINQQARFAENTIYDVKRIIGKRFSELDATLFPFELCAGGKDRTKILVN